MKHLASVFCGVFALMAVVLVGCSDGSSRSRSIEPTQFELAQQDYIDATIANGSGGSYGGMIHIAAGVAPPESSFDRDIEQLNTRDDTADFALPVLLTMLAKLEDSAGMDPALYQRIKEEVIRFQVLAR